jgi:endoglucanase
MKGSSASAGAAVLFVLVSAIGASSATRGTATAATGTTAATARACADPDVNTPRDPQNPLALSTPPTTGDPLQGAHFFVDGPRHGQAAGEIASQLGMNPMSFADSDSWAQFQANHAAAINGNPKVVLLEKIADQEETQNISLFAQGGGPGAIFGQVRKIICNNMTADPTPETVPVLSTFLIYPHGQFCPSLMEIKGWQGTFKRLVREIASAIGAARAVILMEIDSLGTSSCLDQGELREWLADLDYEAKTFSTLPHTVTYEEAGYSDAQGPAWTAKRLWRAGVNRIEGFWTNGTHFAWSSNEISWAEKISQDLRALSHGRYQAHFVVNTAQNGRGPKLNRHPVKQGIESLCNPPGRGLGRIPTGDVHPTFDGRDFKGLDAFLWTGAPGRSHNSNCPAGPWRPAGVFDPRFALELAQSANQQLGPGYPSLAY